jgi:nucleotide-binding universal stress UspA family protein
MFQKLLVPLDGSLVAEQALPIAAAIAAASHAAVDLIAVHRPQKALATQSAIDRSIQRWADTDRYLERRATGLAHDTKLMVTHSVPSGNPVDCICARASDVDADLIVMTSHGRTGFNRFWLGRVADGVVRHSTIPVLMLRASEDEHATPAAIQFRRLLVPLDGSTLAEAALEPAASLALATNAEILLSHLVHPVPVATPDYQMVWAGPLPTDESATRLLMKEGTAYLAKKAELLAQRGVHSVATHVMVGQSTAKAIIALAKARQVDAIAMATHGRGVSRLVIGSVADKVLRGSELPLLIQRPATIAAPRLLEPHEVEEQLPAVSGRT